MEQSSETLKDQFAEWYREVHKPIKEVMEKQKRSADVDYEARAKEVGAHLDVPRSLFVGNDGGAIMKCPFCGGDTEELHGADEGASRCLKCGACGETRRTLESKAQAFTVQIVISAAAMRDPMFSKQMIAEALGRRLITEHLAKIECVDFDSDGNPYSNGEKRIIARVKIERWK